MSVDPAATLRYSANLSMLFGHVPLLERPAAAARAGFGFVESWWPFDHAVPDPGEVDAFCRSLDEAGVRLVALNMDAGDPATGDRGLLSDPASADRVRANLAVVVQILDRTGCRVVNALYGNRLAGGDPVEQDRLAQQHLVAVADAVAGLGAVVVVETLNLHESPRFPLTDVAATARLVDDVRRRSRSGNVGLLVDVYHLATMGTDPAEALRRHARLVHHVQFADEPGRGRPGTGDLDFAAVERTLHAIGYTGYVGLEYVPVLEPSSLGDAPTAPPSGDPT